MGWDLTINVGPSARAFGLFDIILLARRRDEVEVFRGGGYDLVAALDRVIEQAVTWHKAPR